MVTSDASKTITNLFENIEENMFTSENNSSQVLLHQIKSSALKKF